MVNEVWSVGIAAPTVHVALAVRLRFFDAPSARVSTSLPVKASCRASQVARYGSLRIPSE